MAGQSAHLAQRHPQACAENANRPPDLAGFLPWRMDAARLAALRSAPAFTQPPGVDTS
ncbi:MAG: hypothetical protein IPI02_14775 [Sterolibacteriaceae bacterium]|nr:hypothetical protein [Sterolibacteriaceae bacterium]